MCPMLLLLLLQGLECANVQRKKQLLLQEGVKFNGNKVGRRELDQQRGCHLRCQSPQPDLLAVVAAAS